MAQHTRMQTLSSPERNADEVNDIVILVNRENAYIGRKFDKKKLELTQKVNTVSLKAMLYVAIFYLQLAMQF